MPNNKQLPSGNSQHGAALIFSMILLLVLTLLGLSSMRTATLEEKMAYNMRDMNLAFEAAESGLREAETWLDQQANEASVNNQAFVYPPDAAPELTTQTHSWWSNADNSASYGIAGSTALGEVNSQPRFVIEQRAFVPDSLVQGFEPPKGKNLYRVTARGTGATDTAQSISQSTFAKRFN